MEQGAGSSGCFFRTRFFLNNCQLYCPKVIEPFWTTFVCAGEGLVSYISFIYEWMSSRCRHNCIHQHSTFHREINRLTARIHKLEKSKIEIPVKTVCSQEFRWFTPRLYFFEMPKRTYLISVIVYTHTFWGLKILHTRKCIYLWQKLCVDLNTI